MIDNFIGRELYFYSDIFLFFSELIIDLCIGFFWNLREDMVGCSYWLSSSLCSQLMYVGGCQVYYWFVVMLVVVIFVIGLFCVLVVYVWYNILLQLEVFGIVEVRCYGLKFINICFCLIFSVGIMLFCNL